MATGFDSLNSKADSRLHSDMRFFCVRKPTHTRIMAGRNGGAFALAGFFAASLSTLLRPATMFDSVLARLLTSSKGAFHMAVSARPYFVWRFMQCLTDSIAIFTVTAATEREARAQLPHAHLIFVARIRQGKPMHNKTTPDAAAAALTTLMHALIDIECTAELARKEEREEYTLFALECIRYIATRSLNDAKNILVADCENGGALLSCQACYDPCGV